LLEFQGPRRVLLGQDPDGAQAALAEAQAALDGGEWIAGYLRYELGGAFVRARTRLDSPLLVLGIFGEPRDVAAHAGAFELSPLLARVDANGYRQAIDAICSRIYEGEVYQVNYTVPFDLRVTGDALALWDAVRQTTGAQYQAYVEHDGTRLLSWSPELFLSFDGPTVTAKPMKGTSAGDVATLANPKNRAEHVMIVDLLRNDLQRICDDVAVEALCSVERYPHFATMTSTITGALRPNVSLAGAFEATFPCGSVTGAPKRAAFCAIADLEAWPRGAYCGAIGYLSPQRRGWWNVAIRTAQLDEDGYGRYDAGGGIVADSSAGDEWNEVLLKTAFLNAFLQPIELLETFASDAAPATLDAHVLRLSAAAGRFRLPFDEDAVRRDIARAIRSAGHRSLIRLRLHADGRAGIRTEPLVPPQLPVPICLAQERVRSTDPFLRIKSAWRPAHNTALAAAQARGCFDALLRNERGEVTEGARTNIFVEIGGRTYTPPLDSGLLPGILRAHLVSEGRVLERVLTPGDIAQADAIFVGNSARGLLPAKMR